jgi:hypothetical protein
MESAVIDRGTGRVGVVRFGRTVRIPRLEIEAKLGGKSLAAKWDGRSTFSVKEFAEIFGISLWAAYQAVKGSGGKAA